MFFIKKIFFQKNFIKKLYIKEYCFISFFIKKYKFIVFFLKKMNFFKNCIFFYKNNNNDYLFIIKKSKKNLFFLKNLDLKIFFLNLSFLKTLKNKNKYSLVKINDTPYFYKYSININFFCFNNLQSTSKHTVKIDFQVLNQNQNNINKQIVFLTNLLFFIKNYNFISNKYLINYVNLMRLKFNKEINLTNLIFFEKYNFNNYYPVYLNNSFYLNFFKKFKYNYKLSFVVFTNKIIVNFLENFFKKKFFIKITNNLFNKINNKYFYDIINDNKYYQPVYFSNYSLISFIEIVWYSFFLKDLKMMSSWISMFMESLNFKNHKKFLMFFNNFLIKYSGLFIDVLKIKGFFFDIRGKVGVTGSSKKRHVCFKFGSLQKSSKKSKTDFNQNLVRTYSGVMGLTYIINY